MSSLSPLFVPGPFDFGRQVRPLDEQPDMPALHGWELLHTPGHAPGHISLWRPADRLLIAGDAFVTTVQESALSALTLMPRQVHRPPAYYTPDWDAARESVGRLWALGAALAISGHGDAVGGSELERGLRLLADHFDQQARPNRGRYVTEPARTDLSGVTSLPPKPAGRHLTTWAVVALLALLVMRSRRSSS